MSKIRIKTKYVIEFNGNLEERILFAVHNNSIDVVEFFDQDDNINQ